MHQGSTNYRSGKRFGLLLNYKKFCGNDNDNNVCVTATLQYFQFTASCQILVFQLMYNFPSFTAPPPSICVIGFLAFGTGSWEFPEALDHMSYAGTGHEHNARVEHTYNDADN